MASHSTETLRRQVDAKNRFIQGQLCGKLRRSFSFSNLRFWGLKSYRKPFKEKRRNQTQLCLPEIPATWEIEVGGLQIQVSLCNLVKPCVKRKKGMGFQFSGTVPLGSISNTGGQGAEAQKGRNQTYIDLGQAVLIQEHIKLKFLDICSQHGEIRAVIRKLECRTVVIRKLFTNSKGSCFSKSSIGDIALLQPDPCSIIGTCLLTF